MCHFKLSISVELSSYSLCQNRWCLVHSVSNPVILWASNAFYSCSHHHPYEELALQRCLGALEMQVLGCHWWVRALVWWDTCPFSEVAEFHWEKAAALSGLCFFSRPNCKNLLEMNGVINSTGDQAVGKVARLLVCLGLNNFQLKLCLYKATYGASWGIITLGCIFHVSSMCFIR